MDLFSNYVMTINGKAVHGHAEIEVENPATGEVFATAPDCSEEQLDEAVRSARSAFQTWRRTPLEERQAKVAEAGDLLIAHADDLARLFTREQGRPMDGAKQEILGAGACACLRELS
jgi:acyl-CoA reductase-like NAD-dependent aldehyde dehydrogenase